MQEKSKATGTGCCTKCYDTHYCTSQSVQCDCDCHKVQEKSVVERFKLGMAEILGNPNKGKFAMNDMVELFNTLQKETDNKWKGKVGEIIKKIESSKDGYNCYECGSEGFDKGLDQATNIIKELVNGN